MSIFPTKILLATDGSREAHFAAPTAIDLTDKTGSELHVTFVLRTQDAPYTSDYGAVNFDIREAYQEEVKQMGTWPTWGYTASRPRYIWKSCG